MTCSLAYTQLSVKIGLRDGPPYSMSGVELGFTPLSKNFQSYRSDQCLLQEAGLHHQNRDVMQRNMSMTRVNPKSAERVLLRIFKEGHQR